MHTAQYKSMSETLVNYTRQVFSLLFCFASASPALSLIPMSSFGHWIDWTIDLTIAKEIGDVSSS